MNSENGGGQIDCRGFKTLMAGTFCPAIMIVNTIGVEEVTADFYFFAGAILASAGFIASGFAASAAWSRRSTLAVSRSLAT
jgi:hypothetical protein